MVVSKPSFWSARNLQYGIFAPEGIEIRNPLILIRRVRLPSDNCHYRRQSIFGPFAVIGELIMISVVRYWSNSGQKRILARDGLSANDPKRSSAARRDTPVTQAYLAPSRAHSHLN
jgi:hypothetical protein